MAADETPNPDGTVTGTVVSKVTADGSNLPATAQELDAYLRVEGERESDPDADAYARIIEQVLSATSADIVLTPVEALQARDMIGIPLIFYGFDLNKSEFDAGSPFYVSMKCAVAEDGTPAIINCGHKKVIAQCVKLRQFDDWPYNVMFRQRGVSNVGGTPMLELIKWEPEPPAPF